MGDWKELYRTGKRNAAILDGASENFLQTQADKEGKLKHGSFNTLQIINSATTAYRIKLDGIDEDGRSFDIPSTSVFDIRAEEGLFFDNVTIENIGGATIVADAITINATISTPLKN